MNMRPFSAQMTPQHIAIAKLIGDGNCSKGIRIALIRYDRDGGAYTRGKWQGNIRPRLPFGVPEYVDRRVSVRITISSEIRQKAIRCVNSVCDDARAPSVSKGIRVALELYGWNNDCDNGIDAGIVNKLAIIREGLYK